MSIRPVELLCIGIGALLIAVSAHANTLRGNAENCQHFGKVVMRIAVARDNGQSEEDTMAWADQSIADAMGQPGSIVMDNDDAKYIKQVIKDLYGKNKGLGPQEAGVSALVECAKKP